MTTTGRPAPTRADVVFAALAMHWLSTTEILNRLIECGFNFGPRPLREVLRALVADGRAQRDRVGSQYYWRVAKVATAALATPITAEEPDHRIAGHPLENLFRPDDTLVDRIVRRAKYDALKAMLSAANGWHEGALSNHEALGHRGDAEQCCGRFDVDDIFLMVNDAARAVGTAEPYRGADQ